MDCLLYCRWVCFVDGNDYEGYWALGVVVPAVLVCMIVVLISCVVVGFSLRACRRRATLKRQRLHRQHQAALHAAGHFDDSIPSGLH